MFFVLMVLKGGSSCKNPRAASYFATPLQTRCLFLPPPAKKRYGVPTSSHNFSIPTKNWPCSKFLNFVKNFSGAPGRPDWNSFKVLTYEKNFCEKLNCIISSVNKIVFRFHHKSQSIALNVLVFA